MQNFQARDSRAEAGENGALRGNGIFGDSAVKKEARARAEDKVLAACRFIEERSDRPPTLTDIARKVGMSPYHFQRVFKKTLGVTPRQYADAQRVGRLKNKLQRGQGIAPALYDSAWIVVISRRGVL